MNNQNYNWLNEPENELPEQLEENELPVELEDNDEFINDGMSAFCDIL